jgi:hypothetical protein
MLRFVLERGRAGAAEHVAKLFKVTDERVRLDLDEFLRHLESRGLIRSVVERASVSSRPSLGRFVIPPILAFLRQGWLNSSTRICLLLLLARISFALFGWSRTLAMWGRSSAPSVLPPVEIHRTAELVRRMSARHWINTECKERALCCWTLLRWSGIKPSLVIGISMSPLRGHCWCAFDDEILADDPERSKMFTAIKNYS